LRIDVESIPCHLSLNPTVDAQLTPRKPYPIFNRHSINPHPAPRNAQRATRLCIVSAGNPRLNMVNTGERRKKMRIPSKQECLRLIRSMNMLEHIVLHSFQVCRVATFLVDHLETGRNGLSRNLVQAAALLHDITKTRSFTTRENHVLTGAAYIRGLGYPEVGRVIEQHVRLDDYAASDFPTEAAVVNYSDKRVLHDRIVPLQKRMTYILEKYARGPQYRERLLWLWEKTKGLETELFSRLPFGPEELGRRINNETALEDFLPDADRVFLKKKI